jgi:hypothetical protein
MKILKLFHRRKKEEKEKVEVVVRQPPELKLICGDDDEVYKALEETLLLNILSLPSKEFSMEEALERARAREEAARAEKEETEDLRVGLEYRMAGQIALFKGDIEGVKRFFGKAQKLTGKRYLILAVAERAIEKAQEYYELLKTKSE